MKSHPSSLSHLAVAVVSAFLLAAQVQAAPLGQLNPGRVEMPDKAGARTLPTEMPGTLELPDSVVTPEPTPPELEALPSTRFPVGRVTLVGASSYPPGTFDAVLKRLEGHTVNLAEVHAVADTITARYRQAGFLLARTIVPAQRLEGGNLVLQVFEGKVNQVSFTGPSNKALERYADNIRQETPPTSKTIERNLLLMNDVSGNDSRGTLQASPVESGTDLLVENALRKYEGFFGFDNRDSRYFGPWQVYGGVGVNDLSGHGDHLGIRAGKSVEGNKMTFFEGQYEVPVGSQGDVVSFLAQHNDGHADTYSFLNANSSGDTFAVRITRPWIRQRDETLKTSAAFTYYNGTSEYLDDKKLPPSSEDRIRAVRLGASYDWFDAYGGKNLVKAEISKGLAIMGASNESRPNPSRAGGQTDFSKLQMDAQRLQDLSKLMDGLNLYLAATAQTSFGQALLSPEQFGVGGSEFGRGYDPSEITGDSGFALKTELQYNRIHTFKSYAVPTQYYAFWDFGKVWSEDPSWVSRESLSSTGIGAHLNIFKDTYVSPEVAFPLTRSVSAKELDDDNGKAPRLYINFLKLF
ncbi:ShlB/FhaC/HecB family hemolysin secretion/activation protein [Pseudomonas sp. GD04087]|uniref:ShlB/FhaC/HecB family hemolysin secretion/activation protein n=1 Tax=unclassified Pseudomonas TaxID=196821 RepID=UPI00244D2089|nr:MULTISPECIES: ShlB/FhaC/HecB family hemolysin secretion/activation protein [unclassified Pseudomonas]MDH0291895.1 ShlB/FhaC/HecB family hemolysin secretion/activation protein [Pseudomonas sp. GD04087]MDH1051043.1 ShlB/FhaC/HecB family hemolysin secretion/activation protein [Pseudomonas sp. GD03903]MDH1999312.1 ShlB/FhaC/HecB family hemolysin secretion/activation protein [Pseudomonas sp. GD03691]